MRHDLRRYGTVVFDCDGVILASNRVKTEAFFQVAAQFGQEVAEELREFHVRNGGISRYRKFEYFVSNILSRPADQELVVELSRQYGDCVFHELLTCEVAPGLQSLRDATADASWMIVSGGDETELRRVFADRGLAPLFDGGIYGSPATKDEILAREIAAGRLRRPAVFLGDSKYDHVAASRAGLDFVFVSGWTEFAEWAEYCSQHDIPVLDSVGAAMGALEPRARF